MTEQIPADLNAFAQSIADGARVSALEEAAQVADNLSMPPHQFAATEAARNIAMQIRALKQKSR